MAPESFKVSVPGSMMLCGEHAVLHGKQAIVCAVNKRLHITLTPQAEPTVSIVDGRLGTLTQGLDNLHITQPYTFVLAAIMLFKTQFTSGFVLDIESDFSSVIGLGSSAAVTVATIAIIGKWLNLNLTAEQIFALAKQVINHVQGVGSGADIAASIYGGVLGFAIGSNADASSQQNVPVITKLPTIPNLTAVYCGYKTPTAEVIKIVNAAQQQQPDKFMAIFQSLHECAIEAITAIRQANWPILGGLFSRHYKLQIELGVSNNLLDNLINKLCAQKQIYGAKISGSGLGDCVIGLGELSAQLFPQQDGIMQFNVGIAEQGLTYASN